MIRQFSLEYSYLNSHKDSGGLISKYALTHYRHQVIAGLHQAIFKRWRNVIYFRWEDNPHFGKRSWLDAQISWTGENYRLFADATNCLNRTYQDFSGVVLPGRWLKLGLSYTFR